MSHHCCGYCEEQLEEVFGKGRGVSVRQPDRATRTPLLLEEGFCLAHTHTCCTVCTAGCYSLLYLQQGVDQCVQTQVSTAAPQKWKRSSFVQSKMEKLPIVNPVKSSAKN